MTFDACFHIDLTTGELINQLTGKGRVKRWLYNGLHSLDFRLLIDNRPSRDLVVIALSTAGFLFSSTAVIVAWRRLLPRRKRWPKERPRWARPAWNKRLHFIQHGLFPKSQATEDPGKRDLTSIK